VTGAPFAAETPESTIHEVDHLLDEVEAALGRLDEGTYGTCSDCGTAIHDTRLSEDPTIRTCVRCEADVSGQPHHEPLDDDVPTAAVDTDPDLGYDVDETTAVETVWLGVASDRIASDWVMDESDPADDADDDADAAPAPMPWDRGTDND
jgi:hypothetical protein